MIISFMGFMGSGKTTIGRLLSEKLGYKFVDLDLEIEKIQNSSIQDIFDRRGEHYFRNVETEVLKLIIDTYSEDNLVLSLGGGTPCFNNNIDIIKSKTKSVYIKTDISDIIERLSKTNYYRPLIKDKNKKELEIFIRSSLFEREIYYNKADYIVSSSINVVDNILLIFI